MLLLWLLLLSAVRFLLLLVLFLLVLVVFLLPDVLLLLPVLLQLRVLLLSVLVLEIREFLLNSAADSQHRQRPVFSFRNPQLLLSVLAGLGGV